MRRDSILGWSAIVLLVVALVAIFQYEAAQGGGSGYSISWETLQEPGPEARAGSRLGQATLVPLVFEKANVTRVTFTLAWTDDVGEPDALRLSVAGPRGQNASGEGSDGRIVLVLEDLAPVPPPARMLAAGEGEVASRLARDRTSLEATGTWNATVELLRSPGASTPLGVEIQSDGQNDWGLATTMTTYRPVIRLG